MAFTHAHAVHSSYGRGTLLKIIETTTLPGDKRLFVYCLRGTRSRRAVGILRRKGYDAKSIGGIAAYKGELEQ